jgi:hypothetical protein
MFHLRSHPTRESMLEEITKRVSKRLLREKIFPSTLAFEAQPCSQTFGDLGVSVHLLKVSCRKRSGDHQLQHWDRGARCRNCHLLVDQ